MAATSTQALVEFHRPPRPLFHEEGAPSPHPNHFVFRLNPDEGMSLSVQIKEPGERLVSAPVELDYSYDESGQPIEETAYERLLAEALEGDPTLFARADAIEEQWRVVMPVLEEPPPVHVYEQDSWGPEEADDLADGGWHDPV